MSRRMRFKHREADDAIEKMIADYEQRITELKDINQALRRERVELLDGSYKQLAVIFLLFCEVLKHHPGKDYQWTMRKAQGKAKNLGIPPDAFQQALQHAFNAGIGVKRDMPVFRVMNTGASGTGERITIVDGGSLEGTVWQRVDGSG